MRPSPLRLALAAVLLAATALPSRADTIITGLNGYFATPNGGENTGVGTDFFTTGRPLAGNSSNRAEFYGYPALFLPGSSTLPSAEVDIGTFKFYNGVTVTGTSASSVGFFLTGEAKLLDFDPVAVSPVVAQRRIFLTLTPNVTGDPVADGDVWSSDNGTSALIPEDTYEVFLATGRFYPREVHSPPQYIDFEFTRFTRVDDTPAAVPAPPGVVLALLGVAPFAWLARRRRC